MRRGNVIPPVEKAVSKDFRGWEYTPTLSYCSGNVIPPAESRLIGFWFTQIKIMRNWGV